jgi:hypothetical protein
MKKRKIKPVLSNDPGLRVQGPVPRNRRGTSQGVADRVGEVLQRPVASYANGREIVITVGQPESPALALG